MRLYLHVAGQDVQLMENVDPAARICDVVPVADELVFVDDDEEPVAVEVTLHEVLLDRNARHLHLHRHPCRRIAVKVTYGGAPQILNVAPSTRIQALQARALQAFGIDPITGATLVLRLPGTESDLSGSTHLSDLTRRGECRLTLNLLPSIREAG